MSVEEAATIAGVTHNAIAGVDRRIGHRGRLGNMEDGGRGANSAGADDWGVVIAGGRNGRSVRGGDVFSAVSQIKLFYFGKRRGKASGVADLVRSRDVEVKLVVQKGEASKDGD